MKAILKFDLEDVDDRMSHLRCIKSDDLAYVIWEFIHNSRKTLERRAEYLPEHTVYDGVTAVFDDFCKLLEERNINIDELTN
jgi:hypothetical protein